MSSNMHKQMFNNLWQLTQTLTMLTVKCDVCVSFHKQFIEDIFVIFFEQIDSIIFLNQISYQYYIFNGNHNYTYIQLSLVKLNNWNESFAFISFGHSFILIAERNSKCWVCCMYENFSICKLIFNFQMCTGAH